MTYEDKVIDYIAQPENLPVAMEVADAVQKLRESTHRRFWPSFSAVFNQRVMSSEYAETWKYIPFPATRIKKEFQCSSLQPIQPKGVESPVLYVTFGQGGRGGNYRLLSGVAWGRKLPVPNHPALRDLKKELVSRKLAVSWD